MHIWRSRLPFKLRIHLQGPFRDAILTPQKEMYNYSMSSVRISVEWLFGDIQNYFKFIDFKKNLKATKTIALIICVLFICWFPYSVTSMVLSLCKPCFFSVPHELLASLLMLGYLNSALNPFIYSLSNRKIKETYSTLFLSVRKIGRNVLRRSKLWSQTSDSSLTSRRHVSVMGQTAGSVQLTAFTVSLKSR